MKTVNKLLSVVVLMTQIKCLALDNSGNPGFPMTQPFIGNGLCTATDAITAQLYIGIVNGAVTSATNFLGSRITNQFNGGFAITNPASSSMLRIGTNGDVFMGVIDNANIDAGYIHIQTNGAVVIQGGSNPFGGSESQILITDGGPSTGEILMSTDAGTGQYDFGGFGNVEFHTDFTPRLELHQNDSGTNEQGVLDSYIGIGGATPMGRSLHIYTEVGGKLIFENAMYGNGLGITNLRGSNIVWSGYIPLTNLYSVTTNAGANATNYGNLIGANLTNYANSVVAGTTNLNKFNVNTNLFIAGVSQEQIFDGKIVLVAANGVPWSLVYSRTGTYWTNEGSGYGVVTNGNGILPQWNLRDASGNNLSFKSPNRSPQGQWTPNFIATNAPIGDWGRISDFGSGGAAEPWTVTNIPISAITETNSNPDLDMMSYNPVTGKMTPSQFNLSVILQDGGNAGGGDIFNLGTVTATSFVGDGSGLSNLPATSLSITLYGTNFVSGKLLVNNFSGPIQVSANAALTAASVAGQAQLSLFVYGQTTNRATLLTAIGAVTGTATNALNSAMIPVGATYTFTNTSSGSGDSAFPVDGQIIFY